MSDLIAFIKNRESSKIIEYAACADWKDENGKPILWKLRKLTTRELENIRAKTLRINARKRDVQFDNYAFNNAIMAESVVFPNLKDVKLADALLGDLPLDQRTPGNVLYAILENDAEYQALYAKVAELQGWGDNEETEDLVETAKN